MWNVRNLIKQVEGRIIVTRDWLVKGEWQDREAD